MATISMRVRGNQWLWIAAIWFGFGLIAALQTVFVMRAEGMHHAWVTLFITTVASWLAWAVTTVLVLPLGRRFPPVKVRPVTTWFVHLGACAAAGLLFALWATCLDVLFNPYAVSSPQGTFEQMWFGRFYNGVLSSVLLYSAILAASYVLDSKARLAQQQTETARLNEQLSKAQLDALRQQIEPHFLFNTLNAIAGLVREQRNDDAVNMIVRLSEFLRRVLEDTARQQVPLKEELEFAQKYLEIQKARFADRLRIRIDVPNELYRAQVPTLILQPMVENAVKHGIAKRVQGGSIQIAATHRDGNLVLRVCNDGPSLPADWATAHPGIGIANVRTRLQGLYGDGFELTLCNQESGGVAASVSLPFVLPPA